MKFSTDRPPTWQACIDCGNEAAGNRPAPAVHPCAAGCWRSTTARPSSRGDELIAALHRTARGDSPERRPRACGASARSCCPSRRTRRCPTPRATRRCSTARRWTAGPALDQLLLKHEGHNPTGSFKDRGMTVGVTQAVRIGATRRRLRLHRQHLRVARGLRGAGRDSRPGPRAGGQRRPGQAGAVARLRRADAAGARRLRRLPAAGGAGERASSASTCSTRSTRSGSRGRRRSCSSCCSSSAGTRPTGSCSRPATWATPRRSARRCVEAHGLGPHRSRCRASPRCRRRARRRSRGASPRASPSGTGCKAETVATAIRIGDPGLVRPRRCGDPRDQRRRAGGDRRGDPGGQGRGRRVRAWAASRPAPRAWPESERLVAAGHASGRRSAWSPCSPDTSSKTRACCCSTTGRPSRRRRAPTGRSRSSPPSTRLRGSSKLAEPRAGRVTQYGVTGRGAAAAMAAPSCSYAVGSTSRNGVAL